MPYPLSMNSEIRTTSMDWIKGSVQKSQKITDYHSQNVTITTKIGHKTGYCRVLYIIMIINKYILYIYLIHGKFCFAT